MSTLSDLDVLSGSQQVAVHFSQSCPPGAHSDMSEFAAAIYAAGGPSGGNSVSSVAGVSGDTVQGLSNLFSVLTNYYIAVINPVDGVQVGQLRADVMNGLQALGQSKAIPCSNFTVDIIETGTGGLASAVSSGVKAASGGGVSLTTTAVVVAIAIGLVAIVLLSKEV